MTLFSEINDLNDPRVAAAIALYDISFPANEKQPVQVIHDRISKGQARLLGMFLKLCQKGAAGWYWLLMASK